MGNCQSQKQKRENQKTKVSVSSRQKRVDLDELMMEDDGGAMSQKTYDDQEVAKLTKELTEAPQIFVLNNLLMSVMFFENYEREKHRLMHSSRTTLEKELNPTLLRDETIQTVTPDVIFENVHKNVKFRRLHGSSKNKIEPLVPKRIFVVNDNIEVLESKNTPQYSAIDKPAYQVLMEKSEERKGEKSGERKGEKSGDRKGEKSGEREGFIKLKCCPTQARQIDHPGNILVDPEPKPGPSAAPDDQEEIYEYTTIASVNTPKPLVITNYERRDTLPKSCFTMKKIRKYDENLDDSENEEMEEPQDDEKLYETVTYISSQGYMKYFQNAVFPNSLGKALGFGSEEIALAKAIPGKIFSDQQGVDEDFNMLPCEIIPSVAIQWPVDLTFEFHGRPERPTMWDKFGEEYRWPKIAMINDISALNCVLIPRGYIPKRGENVESQIEWEVGFPKAQRYLDTHMSHTQIRAFLFLLTLYKAYIQPANKPYDGLLVDHIRTHMYWECESNPRDWPEHRLGRKMVLVIKSFIKKLSTGELPDFFIKRKNMFLNVPNKHLTHAQKVFHDVLESPAVYFIGALRNLKYTKPNFYPPFDFKELYKILISNSSQLINPRFLDQPPNLIPKNRRPVRVDGDVNYKKEIKWQAKNERMNRERVLRKIKEKEQHEENLRVERRGSVDSIDYEWQSEKQFDQLKIRAILMFFVRHFIEMAKKSRRLASQRQALFYLKQSYYQARILEDIGLEADAAELFELITKEEDTSKKLSISESFEMPPSTPKRNSAQFNTWGEVTQQVKGNNINLNNLNKTYNNTSVPANFNKLKKQPSNLKLRNGVLRNPSFQNEDRRKSGEVRRSVVGFSDTIEIR